LPIARRDLFSSRNRPSEGEINVRKRTGDYEFSVQLPGFTPVIGPALGDFSRRKPILPWVFPLSGFRIPIERDIIAGTTPRRSSASGLATPQAAIRETYPLMGLTALREMAESQTK